MEESTSSDSSASLAYYLADNEKRQPMQDNPAETDENTAGGL